MFKRMKNLLMLLIATAILLPSLSYGQNDNDDINMSYTVYCNNMYGSGDDVTINIYAYYLKKGAEFNFKVYKINDIEGFFSRQTSNYQIDE
jgi:hypothetical protein